MSDTKKKPAAKQSKKTTNSKSNQRNQASPKKKQVSLSRPVTAVKVVINNVETQMLFKRSYQRTDQALIWIDKVIDKLAGDTDIQSADQMIRDKMKTCSERIKEQASAVEQLLIDNDMVNVPIEYKNSFQETIECQTPLSIRYIHLIKDMDRMMKLVDSAWFCDLIDRDQKKKAIGVARSLIGEVSSSIIKLNTAAQAKIKQKKNAKTSSTSNQSSNVTEMKAESKEDKTEPAKSVA